TLLSITQAILGIVPTLDGLKVDPCLPPHMKGYTVIRRYRGATYRIIVDNSAGAQYGVKEVLVNGKAITGQVISPAEPGTETEVKVIMG
ncbi:MAG: glycosyl transferase, partial [Oscillospiraceae bacterium]|nr:glycosyl transferase [Oscillospiraceae bacterium]